MSGRIHGLDEAAVKGRRVLLRADLNVPLRYGHVSDATRIARLAPTIRELAEKGARVIVCSHFDRPKGKRRPEMSLAPLAPALAEALGRPVAFCPDCIGETVETSVARLAEGEVLLLENTRFYSGEEANDPAFAAELAKCAEIFVNDGFSVSHRAHASTEGVAHLLPSYAGRLMEAELKALDSALGHPARPVGAIVGGAKVSTKLELLGNLCAKVDLLMIGGAMANTFLAAQGIAVGRSLEEADRHQEARAILNQAKEAGCEILLPIDAVVAAALEPGTTTQVVPVRDVPEALMILDVGPATVTEFAVKLAKLRTLVWNGPVGAFETPPFAAGTVAVAAVVAEATASGRLCSVAGGGDTVAALNFAHAAERLTYVSTAGGAFLEWLEGKMLPGVAALIR
ncbi:MAG TPA: phosphoglycerate kinase [Acetobacteraceae bacterium]|nr:phosphoglycerate kinase [Acetobacteraceae bacterium]